MNKLFALLTIGLLMIAGIRAPESSLRTNGFCSSGPVLEKAHDSQNDAPEFRRTASNPLVMHSWFAPSFHPFDVLDNSHNTELVQFDYQADVSTFTYDSASLFPSFRPPAFSFA